MSNDLGPKPEPRIEPGEPNPGGVDAVDLDPGGEPTIPNLPTDKNPAVSDEAPDEVTQGEDTATEATRSDGGESADDEPGEPSE